ncbi:MAG TPA: hypothetical protein VFP95_07225 [Gammaproteobacteria bacterium]|nr:hypothetical protein [Gammaproteobacteria bacterium]
MTDALFSRSGASHPAGKCTEELKTQVPEAIREELTALAVLRRVTLSEYLRELVTVHIHGHLYVARMAQGVDKGNGDYGA